MDERRALSFIGKRPDVEEEIDEKRAPRTRTYIGKKSDSEQVIEEKRARFFIGKRTDPELEFEEKRARSFIGRNPIWNQSWKTEEEVKRARTLIGKRLGTELELNDADEEKRARSFIGKRSVGDGFNRGRTFPVNKDSIRMIVMPNVASYYFFFCHKAGSNHVFLFSLYNIIAKGDFFSQRACPNVP